jgi:hypothetical protein
VAPPVTEATTEVREAAIAVLVVLLEPEVERVRAATEIVASSLEPAAGPPAPAGTPVRGVALARAKASQPC